jgi:hypothetical protein
MSKHTVNKWPEKVVQRSFIKRYSFRNSLFNTLKHSGPEPKILPPDLKTSVYYFYSPSISEFTYNLYNSNVCNIYYIL